MTHTLQRSKECPIKSTTNLNQFSFSRQSLVTHTAKITLMPNKIKFYHESKPVKFQQAVSDLKVKTFF